MKYTLRYNTEWECYMLTPHPQQDGMDCSYSMLIQYCYGEYSYKFIMYMDGDWYYINTRAELNERIQDIAEHEGDEVARHWRMNQEEVHVEREDHYIFKAKEYWEALTLLCKLDLEVSWKGFPYKSTKPELIKELDDLRNKWMEENYANE